MDTAGLHLQGRSVVIGRASSNLPAFLAILLVIVWIQARNRSPQDRQTKWARRQRDLNAAMIASTPAHGGHYLIDVPAGAGLAMAAIVLVKRLRVH